MLSIFTVALHKQPISARNSLWRSTALLVFSFFFFFFPFPFSPLASSPVSPKTAAATTAATLPTKSFAYNSNCANAYRALLALQITKGHTLIQAEKQQNPNNAMPVLLENYADILRVYVAESKADFEQWQTNKNKRLETLANTTDKQSPYYRYAQAEINLQWAFARLKFEQYYTAFWEVRRAYKLLEENRRLFPDFYPNLKSLGLIHALIGTIPDQYKWGVKILGIEGNIAQGMGELQDFLDQAQQNDRQFYEEGRLIYIFLMAYLQNNTAEAYQLSTQLSTQNHVLNTFVAANMAFRAGQNDRAIQLLEQRPTDPTVFDFPYLDFMLGSYKLNRLDIDANVYLQRFLNRFKGRNFVKDAYQRMAWHSLLQDEQEGYLLYMGLCETKGSATNDSDRQALKAAQSGRMPHKKLLKARLLYDGGYYHAALKTMNALDAESLKNIEHRLEYEYRYGRICEHTGQTDEALSRYKKVLDMDKNSGYYFAPKSCLQMALLFEQQNNKVAARQYFKQCFEFKNYDYKNSIEQQAKAGLLRIGQP